MKSVELNFQERYFLIKIFNGMKSDAVTTAAVFKIISDVAVSDEDFLEAGGEKTVIQGENGESFTRMNWDKEKEPKKVIDFPEEVVKFVRSQLEALDSKKEVTLQDVLAVTGLKEKIG